MSVKLHVQREYFMSILKYLVFSFLCFWGQLVLGSEVESTVSSNYGNWSGTKSVGGSIVDGWEFEVNRDFVIADEDGLIFPKDGNYIDFVATNTGDTFQYSDGKLDSLIDFPTYTIASASSSSGCSSVEGKRPTLIVTIPGYKGMTETGLGTGNYVANFQNKIDETLKDLSVGCNLLSGAYTEVWNVDWDSARAMEKQRRLLMRKIHKYLQSKNNAWDLVIVGYSRGGIIANEIASTIGTVNVNNLYVVLLDPTAAIFFGDRYPKALGSPSIRRQKYAYLFYNDDTFIDEVLSDSATSYGLTESDKPIAGYQLYVFNKSVRHKDYADKWVEDNTYGVGWLLNVVAEHKEPIVNNIVRDKNCSESSQSFYCSRVIRIRSDKIIDLNGKIGMENGNFVVDGQLYVGPVVASTYAAVGKDGVSMSASFLTDSASLIANKDIIEIRSGGLLVDTYGSLTGSGISVSSGYASNGLRFNGNLNDISVTLYVAGHKTTLSVDSSSLAKAASLPFVLGF